MRFADRELVAIIVFLVSVFASRFVNEKANRCLNGGERESLIEAFARYRLFFMLPVVVILVSYFILIRALPAWFPVISTVYLGVILAYIIGTNFITLKKIRDLNLPAAYKKYFIASKLIVYSGLAFFLYVMAMMSFMR